MGKYLLWGIATATTSAAAAAAKTVNVVEIFIGSGVVITVLGFFIHRYISKSDKKDETQDADILALKLAVAVLEDRDKTASLS